MNIDKLLEILNRTNQPMGSSTGLAIYQSLLKGNIEEAKVIVFNDGDKLTQYPELEKWVIDNLGNGLHNPPDMRRGVRDMLRTGVYADGTKVK